MGQDPARRDGPTRRGLLCAGAMGGTAWVFASGCGTDPAVARRQRLDLRTLREAIADEQRLIELYRTALRRQPNLGVHLSTPLAHHRQHLTRLRRQISPATPSPTPSSSPTPSTAVRSPVHLPSTTQEVLLFLRTAERDATHARLRRVTAVSPSIAQLLASIAAAEASHATFLERS